MATLVTVLLVLMAGLTAALLIAIRNDSARPGAPRRP